VKFPFSFPTVIEPARFELAREPQPGSGAIGEGMRLQQDLGLARMLISFIYSNQNRVRV
jgi:hypothetical protein